MTYTEVNELIESIGLPYNYDHFEDETDVTPPFVTFAFTDSDDLMADNVNYQQIRPLSIFLYTRLKDFETEAKVEGILTENGLTYSRSEKFLSNEKLFRIIYTMEVLINAEEQG
ncbi:MAG: hypothetical protein K6E91_11110 [Butyrivibrio sp.]|nr:hypothetical protein [Butyrivibrio sp.]